MTIQTKETTIAGSPADFMEVKHIVLRDSNREIGHAIAEIVRDSFDVQLIPAPDAVVLRASREYLQKHYPIHCQRMLESLMPTGSPINDDRFF